VNTNPDETVPSYFMTTMKDIDGTLLYGYVYLSDYDSAVESGTDLNVQIYSKTTDGMWYSTEGTIRTSYVSVVYAEDGTPTVTVSIEAQTAIMTIYNDWQTVESAKFGPFYSITLGCYVAAESKTSTAIKDISVAITDPDNMVVSFTDTDGLTMWGTIYMDNFTAESTTVPVFLNAVYTNPDLEKEYYYAVLSLPVSDIVFNENYHDTTVKITAAGERSIIGSYNAWQTHEDARFGDVESISVCMYAPDGTSTHYIPSDISTTYENADNWLYRSLPNADQTYIDFNDLNRNLTNTVTDGEYNIAMVIGPITGDILFDGKHTEFFESVYGILPSAIRDLLPSDSYAILCDVWKSFDDETKNAIDYLLTYELGTVSAIDETGVYQYVKFIILTKEEPMSDLSMKTVQQMFTEKDRFFETHYYVDEAYMAGAAVSNYEISEIVSDDFNTIMIVVVLLLMVLLFIVMRSYLTPVRAVATIVMSILWTLGLTFVLFEHILGIPVVWIVPIVLFVICLGLGMDYDILLTTRIKENVHSKGMSNDDAITDAVQKSGAVITLCGLIMGGAFMTMTMSTSPMLQEFGFALGFAILVDALIIRTYVVPALMHLMGEWNWKGPAFMHRKKQST
ncbi:MAG: MMPL family transporter, partial [Candidatus Methanomethylophilaceae archaeon]